MNSTSPRMYSDLAEWFHLLSAPHEYDEEAALLLEAVRERFEPGPGTTLLELGSGGGNLASHYKRHFTATLTDVSEEMLAISRAINPELEHIQGDMRILRLGREFDVVFTHDAIDYMVTGDDLRAAIETAYVHTRPGGIAIFEPDALEETFHPSTSHGGNDGEGRSMRYLEWDGDRHPDGGYTTEYVMLLQEDGKPVRCVHESHHLGLFPRETWLRLFREAGFEESVKEIPGYDEGGLVQQTIFVTRKPG